ncbi:hypothetical protein CDCA_CDCA02G0706 [Cyanidium caldarium]|uniref:PNO1 second type I KH domain-containing protein n=1 Tax=Cyanidium caldarium TaxID=2771 RepID=A0AAV9IR58_CYACA|nr:hypothetical protein CDCA_CDCA02G0706 [Cyanidium caldarium]
MEVDKAPGAEAHRDSDTPTSPPCRPHFQRASAAALRAADGLRTGSVEQRRVPVPPHRYTPLKQHWLRIYEPIVKELHLQVRMNLRQRAVELRTCRSTDDAAALQRGAEFVRAFMLGFDVDDALALIRLDDILIESFEVGDVKRLHGDHLSRAIGRVAGAQGRMKFAIENACKVRVVLADAKIHLMGSYRNIRLARDAICALILGAPPGKTYEKLRRISARLNERF